MKFITTWLQQKYHSTLFIVNMSESNPGNIFSFANNRTRDVCEDRCRRRWSKGDMGQWCLPMRLHHSAHCVCSRLVSQIDEDLCRCRFQASRWHLLHSYLCSKAYVFCWFLSNAIYQKSNWIIQKCKVMKICVKCGETESHTGKQPSWYSKERTWCDHQ